MTDDECQLLLRSHADQAARNVDPAPRTEVLPADEAQPDLPSKFEISFHLDAADPGSRSAAIGARDRCRALLDDDPSVAVVDPFNTNASVGLTLWNGDRDQYHRIARHRPADHLTGFDAADAAANTLPEDDDLAPAPEPLARPHRPRTPRKAPARPRSPQPPHGHRPESRPKPLDRSDLRLRTLRRP